MMRTFTPLQAALCAAFALGAACGGGEPTGPRPGTPEHTWNAAAEFQEAGNFDRAIDRLDSLVSGDSELKHRAALWRAVLLDGLARGHQELAEGYRLAIKNQPKLASQYQNALQQAYSDGRQYAIRFVESMGDLEKALAVSPALHFPFPSGVAGKPPALATLEKGDAVLEAQLATLPDLMIRRGVILAASELAGKGEAANEAQAAFTAGPVTLDVDATRLCVAKVLLDRSVLFDRMRLYQPDIRKILVDRAETWTQPYLESADEQHKTRAQKLKDEIADERLELEGKRRRLDLRG